MLLNRPVLVLNRLWQAIHVCSARRAFSLLCQGHAQVVHTDDGSFSTHDFDSWRSLSQREPGAQTRAGEERPGARVVLESGRRHRLPREFLR